MAITKDSILISEVGKAPASYLFHDRLAAGTVHKLVVAATSYRVSDIKVGDLVTLGLVKENKQNYCIDLSVRERPGGLVPPGQAVEPGAGFTYYRWQNAQIAFRDHGTPIPEHLKPQVPSDLPKESNLPPEQHRGDYARAYGKKLNLPWLFRCSERKLDFDVAERKVLTGMVAEVPDHGCGLTIIAPRRGKVYYPFHDRLDSKTVQEKATSAFSYLKTDIKVGDILSIGVIKQGHGVPCCADVSIRERPGGLVPAPQIVHKSCPYHEQRNAELASETRGHRSPFLSDRSSPRAHRGPDPFAPKSYAPGGNWTSIRNSISTGASWSRPPVPCSL